MSRTPAQEVEALLNGESLGPEAVVVYRVNRSYSGIGEAMHKLFAIADALQKCGKSVSIRLKPYYDPAHGYEYVELLTLKGE